MTDSKIKKQKTNKKKGVVVNGNLIPAKKGEPSRNPAGRPKKAKCVSDLIRLKLDEPCIYKTGLTNFEAIVEKVIGLAVGGDINAIRTIFDRVDGKPFQKIFTQERKMDTLIVTDGTEKYLHDDAGNKYDLDGDGVISDEELEHAKDIKSAEAEYRKMKAQRRMATAVLIFMALYTAAMFLPIIPDERIKLLTDLSNLLYITGGGIVGAYMGVSAWMSKK